MELEAFFCLISVSPEARNRDVLKVYGKENQSKNVTLQEVHFQLGTET